MTKYLIRYSSDYQKEAKILCLLLRALDIETDRELVSQADEKIFQIIEENQIPPKIYSLNDSLILLNDLMREIAQCIIKLQSIVKWT